MIRIIIADNHPVMLEGIKSAVLKAPEIHLLAEAHTAAELLDALTTNVPDILLLDVKMEHQDGIELARRIRQKYPEIRILFLSQFDDNWLIKKCLDLGAKGYLLKNVSKTELINAINKAAEGEMDFFFKSGQK